MSEVYYSDYLQLDKILSAQEPESIKAGLRADDEMLFIIIHQTYELWFKQILFELEIVRSIFGQSGINDNSPDIIISVHRLKRIASIFMLAVDQINIIETMTPLDFLDFRNLLRPASGFQSIQFKIIEATLGLKYEHRFAQEYYISMLKPADVQKVKEAESLPSIVTLIKQWLERMPFFEQSELWQKYMAVHTNTSSEHTFWNDYRKLYDSSLVDAEKSNLQHFDELFMENMPYPENRSFSRKANRSILFIMLYRDYPLMQLPFQLLNTLLDIDELISTWRYRHVNMVHRMIGTRIGTGGSSGKDYLRSALDKHYIFKEIAELTSFLIERRNLPVLTPELQHILGYSDINKSNVVN
ncbi:MAG: tryptophan 2,3-dioxygenase [Chitinophagales bacterium]|nr:tryptophan 2,3-dioxygenase [Chitinophagales bacterium]